MSFVFGGNYIAYTCLSSKCLRQLSQAFEVSLVTLNNYMCLRSNAKPWWKHLLFFLPKLTHNVPMASYARWQKRKKQYIKYRKRYRADWREKTNVCKWKRNRTNRSNTTNGHDGWLLLLLLPPTPPTPPPPKPPPPTHPLHPPNPLPPPSTHPLLPPLPNALPHPSPTTPPRTHPQPHPPNPPHLNRPHPTTHT